MRQSGPALELLSQKPRARGFGDLERFFLLILPGEKIHVILVNARQIGTKRNLRFIASESQPLVIQQIHSGSVFFFGGRQMLLGLIERGQPRVSLPGNIWLVFRLGQPYGVLEVRLRFRWARAGSRDKSGIQPRIRLHPLGIGRVLHHLQGAAARLFGLVPMGLIDVDPGDVVQPGGHVCPVANTLGDGVRSQVIRNGLIEPIARKIDAPDIAQPALLIAG